MSKRILIFSLAYHPFIGGAEVAVKEVTDRVRGFAFDMITVNLDGRQKPEEKIGNIRVFRLGRGQASKYSFPLFAAKFAKERHRQQPYDAIWAIMANQAGLAARFFKTQHLTVPYLLTLQEGDSEFDILVRTAAIRPLYKSIYRQADQIQAISQFLARRAKNMGATAPIEVIPNGVDFSKIPSVHAKKTSADEKIIITASRLVKKNGVDTLIEAIKVLTRAHPDLAVKLVILGGGKEEVAYKKLTRALKLEDRVTFAGHIEPEKIYERMMQGDVFVRPSRSEGLGSAFLEAMAVGLPVIGTPVGGIPDFLHDGETGLVCQVDDPKGLAEKLYLLLTDQALYQKLSQAGLNLARERYQWDAVAAEMESIFNRLTEQG